MSSVFYRLTQQVQGTGAWRWYASREANERPVIAGVFILVIVAVLWLAIWKPVSDWRLLETNRYQNALDTWEWMQANEANARTRARASTAGPSSERSLMPLVTREANAQGLRLNRLQPESDGAVSVVLQAQSFNSVIEWLNRHASQSYPAYIPPP
ncbi:MAG: type II secretion system protein GspM [Pseudomonadota bacterium]